MKLGKGKRTKTKIQEKLKMKIENEVFMNSNSCDIECEEFLKRCVCVHLVAVWMMTWLTR